MSAATRGILEALAFVQALGEAGTGAGDARQGLAPAKQVRVDTGRLTVMTLTRADGPGSRTTPKAPSGGDFVPGSTWDRDGPYGCKADRATTSCRPLAAGRNERCRVDANEQLPFACPEGCVLYEPRKVSQAGWQVTGRRRKDLPPR